ncbi:hypothetical protein [uncultured Parabacteroides sp.]|jgi:hypothetical protein|uniref:hypothetical protein n=1 Tax=Parabacteroides sp. ASD2025 TaxID=3415987 RepID=UPI0025F29D5D|nr:hypothetical protein [uncultured Parabacteroides sp.]
MNKVEFIQAIADKTSVDTNIIKKVIDACEAVLMENVPQGYVQSPDLTKTDSFKNNKNVKIVQFPNPANVEHKTN